MADAKLLEILEQGVKSFNSWREEKPGRKPDLSEANLRGANLNGANLGEADLSGADISEASLRGAYLSKANLRGVNLHKAHLSETNMRGANLHRADLHKADLSGAFLSWTGIVMANLHKANLRGADLTLAHLWNPRVNEANFSHAKIGYTSFENIDLSNVSGLENTIHEGPSTIGIDTIFRSGGKIPHNFLEGAGVPQIFIEYMGSLTGQAFQFYSCFISYSNDNNDFADRLYADLKKEGVRCWFAPEDMRIGDEIRSVIDKEIRIRDKVLLVLSDSSINSEWIKDEVESAYEEEKRRKKTVLFPICIDTSVMEAEQAWAAKLRRQRYIGDFSNWRDHDSYQQQFKKLLNDLRAVQ